MNENGTFAPLLTTTDWNEEWKRLQEARERFDDPAVWDERARTFPAKHGSQYGYAQSFINLASLFPGESVFDMGCGTGSLALPLARAGHLVIACDFSQGMLDVMREGLSNLGDRGANVDVRLLSWDDDWDAHGIGENCANVAFASRSIATRDLQGALMKLERVARRRVCVTLPASLSPRADNELLAAAGFEPGVGRDFLYAFNILVSHGIAPEVAYIPNTRLEVFDSPEDALAKFAGIVRSAVRGLAAPEQLEKIPQRLRSWLDENLVHDELGFHLARPRNVVWAFLAWAPRQRAPR